MKLDKRYFHRKINTHLGECYQRNKIDFMNALNM